MASLSHAEHALNWTFPPDAIPLVPPELEVLDELELDVFADDDNLGLMLYEPRPTFADYLEYHAGLYRSQEDAEAVFIANLLQAAADNARRHSATTPAELEARQELEDDDRDNRLRAEGYDSAMKGLEPASFRHSAEYLAAVAEGKRRDAEWAEKLVRIGY